MSHRNVAQHVSRGRKQRRTRITSRDVLSHHFRLHLIVLLLSLFYSTAFVELLYNVENYSAKWWWWVYSSHFAHTNENKVKNVRVIIFTGICSFLVNKYIHKRVQVPGLFYIRSLITTIWLTIFHNIEIVQILKIRKQTFSKLILFLQKNEDFMKYFNS